MKRLLDALADCIHDGSAVIYFPVFAACILGIFWCLVYICRHA